MSLSNKGIGGEGGMIGAYRWNKNTDYERRLSC